MEQTVFDYGENWLLTFVCTYNSTVIQWPSLLQYHISLSGNDTVLCKSNASEMREFHSLFT